MTLVFEMMTITKSCPLCGKVSTLVVEQEAFRAWKSGTLIQQAFPGLTSSQREIIQTGIDQDCWTKMWEEEADAGN